MLLNDHLINELVLFFEPVRFEIIFAVGRVHCVLSGAGVGGLFHCAKNSREWCNQIHGDLATSISVQNSREWCNQIHGDLATPLSRKMDKCVLEVSQIVSS